jgi:protocatechuate 3,4-dioxygenase beta subunit
MKLSGCLIFFFLLSPVQTATPMSKEKCTIEGTVFDAGRGMPLAGAEISILKNDGTGSALVVSTDGQGHYTAEGIAPGQYTLLATRRGYVPQTYGQKINNRKGMTLLLESGMKLHEIDFRLVQTGIIAGKVLDQNGEPIAGATVQAVTPRYVDGELRLIGGAEPTRTNDLGEYRIYGLAPDRYYVGVSGQDPDQRVFVGPRGAAPEERYLPTLYQNGTDIDGAVLIKLAPGGELLGMDIVVAKSRTYHVRGSIAGVGPDDHLTRVQLKSAGVAWEIGTRGAEIVPDARGDFDFGGVTPGSYILSTSFIQNGKFLSASRIVEVGSTDVENVKLVSSQRLLRGRVSVEGAGKIDFRRIGLDLASSYSMPLQAVMASDGSFVVAGLGPYKYRVEVSGAEDFYLKSVRLGDEELANKIVDFSTAEETAGTLEIVLSANGGQVDGVVVNEKGQPVNNAVVVLIPDVRRREDSGLFKNTTTDEKGQFAMRGIGPGNYKLFAWDDIESGMWWDTKFLSRYEEKGEEVTIQASQHLSQTLYVIPVQTE